MTGTNGKDIWVKYKNRESVVRVYDDGNGEKMVYELWPLKESPEESSPWSSTGYEVIEREVFWTTVNNK